MKIEAGRSQYFEGFRVTLEIPKPKKRKSTNPIAQHEADHIIPAVFNGTPVEMASIIGTADYSGITKMGKLDPVAAAGPYSQGDGGTGSDEQKVMLMGHNIGSMASAANRIISSHIEEREAVAVALEE